MNWYDSSMKKPDRLKRPGFFIERAERATIQLQLQVFC